MDENSLLKLLNAQQGIIERIARAAPLSVCLNEIASALETLLADPDAIASILLKDGNRVRNGAAPSLPVAYVQGIDGLEIGPCAGSCGTAMYHARQVLVSDIASDPRWAAYRDFALPFGLRACWSQPILDSQGEVLGSFAIYYRHPGLPTPEHLDAINRFAHLSGLAIERDRDAERKRRLLAEVEQSRHRLRALTDTMPDMALVLDAEGRYVDFYGHDEDLLSQPAAHLIGRSVREMLPAATADAVMAVVAETLSTGQTQIVEYELDVPRGHCTFEGRTARIDGYSIDTPDMPHVVWAMRDISERKRNELEIERLAFYDTLTGLPNRQLLMDRLHQILQHLARDPGSSALLFIDLDDFKRINDSLGHQHGDELLRQVAQRLQQILRGVDTIARLGGDEFVVLLAPDTTDLPARASETIAVARKLLAQLEQPFELAQAMYRIHGSVGIAVFDAANHDANEVLRRADAAMYAAKARQGEHWAFFDPALQAQIDQRMRIERDLQQAIERDDFVPCFQPQLAPDGRLVGVEALIRWQHPQHGLLLPEQFVPVAEHCGQMHALQAVVLRAACRLLNTLRERELQPPGLTVSINLSPVQFRDGRLEDFLVQGLAGTGVEPRDICLELTENTLVGDLAGARTQMERLRARGFALSLDDFGTGYSSLAYLHRLPLNEIKIDRRFVADIQNGDETTPIVDAILTLAARMGCRIVAEGVETGAQARGLIARGVNVLQGYHYAAPMPAEALLAWIGKRPAQPD